MREYASKIDFSSLRNRKISKKWKLAGGGLLTLAILATLILVPSVGALEVTHVESPSSGEMIDVQNEQFNTQIANMFMAEFGHCQSADGLNMRCEPVWGSLIPV